MQKIVLIIFILVLSSCNKSGDYESSVATNEAVTDVMSGNDFESENDNSESAQSYIIQNGSARIESNDIDEAKKEIDLLIKEFKAKTSNQSLSDYGSRKELNLVIKIPANNFDNFLKALKNKFKNFESMNVSSEDVTRQYVDYEARLKTQIALEERLKELLQNTTTVDEVIKVETQLAEVRGTIESMQGQFNVLKDQVKFSTLDVSIYENTYSENTSSRFVDSLRNGWEAFVNFLFAILWMWPFVLLVLAILAIIKYSGKKPKKN